MARLKLNNQTKAQSVIDEIRADLSRRIVSGADNCCPLDLISSFLKSCSTESCGKCVPCRVGLTKMQEIIDNILDGNGKTEDVELLKATATSIYNSADCAIGYEGAKAVLNALDNFHDDFISHIENDRCLADFGNSVPCVKGCPAGVDIPAYVALIKEGKYDEAVKIIRKDNPFPSVCGLICEHPCETKCRRKMLDAPLNIRGLKRFAVENSKDVKLPKPLESTGKKIAIVGGGPSGLTAAYYLRLMGHEVTVFEEKKSLGGMLLYGIPAYRLPRERLNEEINVILSLGIKVNLNTKIGKDFTVESLRKSFDAVYLAIGAQTDKKLGIEGEDANGVISAVEMLKSIGDGDMLDFKGQNVVVVGGGNVAMDVARSSVRLGAKSVKIVYRRRKDDMTALREEIEGAIAEGVEVMELLAPVSIEKDKDGNVCGLITQPQIIGEYDRGRPKPCKANKPEYKIDCDKILIAIGQGIESGDFEEEGIPVKRGNIIASDYCGVNGIEGVFAGGDCVTGPATVIKAIAAGKVASANIDEYLGFNHKLEVGVEIPASKPYDRKYCGRVNMTERCANVRKNDFKLMENCMSEEEAIQEASRCLRCDHFGCGSFKGGRVDKW